MKHAYYKHLYNLEGKNISIRYETKQGTYSPAHWHPALELLYILNGTAEITINGTKHTLVSGEFLVIDPNQIHESQCALASMEICVHVSADYLKSSLNVPVFPSLACSRDTLSPEQQPYFFNICDLFKKLTPLYIKQPPAMNLAADSIVMEILFLLFNHFARYSSGSLPQKSKNQERIKEILLYIEKNYTRTISLEEIASHFGLNREYFCRFFKQQMGITFSRHVNQVRLSHIHHELLSTPKPIMEIITENGFTNYKLFHKLFKEIYGCTPRRLRSS